MTHVRTSPKYPQSNGKMERWYQTLKSESIRKRCPLDIRDVERIISSFVNYYNTLRLHSALGYISPLNKLLSFEKMIFKERDRKLSLARQKRMEYWEKVKSSGESTKRSFEDCRQVLF